MTMLLLAASAANMWKCTFAQMIWWLLAQKTGRHVQTGVTVGSWAATQISFDLFTHRHLIMAESTGADVRIADGPVCELEST